MRTSPTLHKGAIFVGHGETPLEPPVYPPQTGTGELTNTMFGAKALTDYPEGTTPLELMCWHNYRDLPMPKIFPSIEENQKMWQGIEVDRMLDYHPAHEIHAKNLPDYHFWPAILNDIEPPNKARLDEKQAWEDRTDIPRFNYHGIPKTPMHEQVYYVPRLSNGRRNWKLNAIKNTRQATAYCSEDGWNARYFRRTYRPWLAARSASRQAGVASPLYFVHRQIYKGSQTARWLKGSWWNPAVVYLPFYGMVLLYAGSKWADYEGWYWPGDGPYNPDIMFMTQLARDGGAYADLFASHGDTVLFPFITGSTMPGNCH